MNTFDEYKTMYFRHFRGYPISRRVFERKVKNQKIIDNWNEYYDKQVDESKILIRCFCFGE